MKEVSLTELKKLSAEGLKDSPCFQVTVNCEPVAIVIVGAMEGMKDRIRVLASQLDAARGK